MRKTGAVPHAALIYTDWAERNRMLDSCLEDNRIGRHSVLVRTCQPKIDVGFFGRRVKRAKPRGAKYPPSVIDVRDVLAGSSPAKGLLSIVREAREKSPEGSSLLVIGDWTHSIYDRFEIALEVEEAERGMSNLLCCYRGEGFWSLEARQIARILGLHSRVLIGPRVLETTPTLAGGQLGQA